MSTKDSPFRFAQGKRPLDGLDDDIREHIDRETQDNIDRGMTPEEAHRQAMLTFGNVALVKEDTRAVWAWRRVDEFRQDTGYALRTLRRNPGFAAVAVLTLALGIGANTAVFGVLYSMLLQPLPYANPDEIVAVSVYVPQLRSQYPSLPVRAGDFEEFRRSNDVFSGMAAVRERDFNLTGSGEPERLYGARVSANLFSLLGVQPRLGRTFLAEEDAPGRDRVVVISHELWVRRFGADPEIVNRPISLDGEPYSVIGVMPAEFAFPTGRQLHTHVELGPRIDAWKPMAFTREDLAPDALNFSWGVLARLKPGTSRQVAQAHLDAVAQRIGREVLTKVPGLGEVDLRTQIVPVRQVFSGDAQQGLVMIMGAVTLLLVIACVNLVNLLIARLSSRSRELATRMALGAPRARLARQLLTESMVLAALGGAAGVALAVWGTHVLASFGPADLEVSESMVVSGPVLLFALGTIVAVGLAVGLVPAVQIGRRDLHAQIAEDGRGSGAARRTGRLRRSLVTSEVALCTALLVVAGLLLRSFVKLMEVDKGFGVERVLSVDLAVSRARYEGAQTVAVYEELLDGIRALPGVTSAGAISVLPLTSQSAGEAMGVYLESDTEQRLDRPVPHYRIVTQGYFGAMGIPLLAGRLFEARESASVVLVSEELGRRLWPDAAPSDIVGRRVKVGEVTEDPATIAGVVGDVRAAALDREPVPAIYVPHARNRDRAMTIVIRSAQDPSTLAAALRAVVWKRDPTIPVPAARTMREIVSASIAPRRFQMAMVLLFAVLALALALVGVYGVTSYAVARQTREIGVRIALGAQRSALLRSVLAQGLRPVALGLCLGVPAAIAAATAVRSLLFRIAPLDPLVLCAMSAALLFTAAIACYIPARRAAGVDAIVALRDE
jgi:putative ABC transport system permease protein